MIRAGFLVAGLALAAPASSCPGVRGLHFADAVEAEAIVVGTIVSAKHLPARNPAYTRIDLEIARIVHGNLRDQRDNGRITVFHQPALGLGLPDFTPRSGDIDDDIGAACKTVNGTGVICAEGFLWSINYLVPKIGELGVVALDWQKAGDPSPEPGRFTVVDAGCAPAIFFVAAAPEAEDLLWAFDGTGDPHTRLTALDHERYQKSQSPPE